MNFNAIQTGEDYAYVEYRRRNHFHKDAIKVRVLSKEKKKHRWQQNATGKVRVTFQSPVTKKQIVREVDARNLIDFWDDYFAELQHVLRDEAERHASRHAENLRRQQETVVIQGYLMTKLGIPAQYVVGVTETEIHLSRQAIETMLDISYDPIEQMRQQVEQES